MKVLIADDDATTRLILQKSLGDWRYDTVEAADGPGAWEILAGDNPPRIAILDWVMPGEDGLAICSRLKQSDTAPYTYIILLTGRGEKEDILDGFAAGADDYLIKPVDIDELRSRLHAGARILEYEDALRNKEFQIRLECFSALTRLAEARDRETGAHLKRLAAYTRIIAEKLGMKEDFITGLERFSPMHDIGKVGVPDNILHAPRKLTAEEFEVIKTHTTLGARILESIPTMELAAEIACSHHERFDGQGYPDGLAGEQIPISGRIVMIADVYDALRSFRVYKAPWPHDQSVDIILSQDGAQFDPAVASAFREEHGAFEEAWETFQEEESDF
jgi:putative two-component system response regulator